MESPAGQVLVLRLASIPQPNWTSGHRGVDLAMTGTRVVSPASGPVAFAGWVVNRPVISIAHGDGLVTSIEPVTATVPAEPGDHEIVFEIRETTTRDCGDTVIGAQARLAVGAVGGVGDEDAEDDDRFAGHGSTPRPAG